MNREQARLLSAADVRRLAEASGVRPTKQRGQNFVTDPNTVRKIVRTAQLEPDEVVVEIGPGLGSLTLALLQVTFHVTAIEIDDGLAASLPTTIEEFAPGASLTVMNADALAVTELGDPQPTALVANLPYNVSVPVLLHFLQTFSSITRALVLVQAEVAHRLAATPGSRIYGVPSVKAAWYGRVGLAGTVSRSVFWPVPNVDSALVGFERADPPGDETLRRATFAVIDAAFAQRRKTLRAALAGLFGSPPAAEAALSAAGVSSAARGEQLGLDEFVAIADRLAS